MKFRLEWDSLKSRPRKVRTHSPGLSKSFTEAQEKYGRQDGRPKSAFLFPWFKSTKSPVFHHLFLYMKQKQKPQEERQENPCSVVPESNPLHLVEEQDQSFLVLGWEWDHVKDAAGRQRVTAQVVCLRWGENVWKTYIQSK